MDDNKFENWLPLESNCDVLNKYLDTLGIQSQIVHFVDILSFDKEFLPEGSVGALFVYPDSKHINNYFFNLGDKVFERQVHPEIYYMKQIAENACGTIALLHIIANIYQELPYILKENSFAGQFIESTGNMNPEDRAIFLKECKIEIKKDGQKKTLQQVHKEAANEDVKDQEVELKAGHHFISFIWHKGSVYELDGRKKGVINYLNCEQHEFMAKVSEIVIKNYINQDEKEIGFNLMALQVGF